MLNGPIYIPLTVVTECWLKGNEPAHSFGYYSGLDSSNFQPLEQLTDDGLPFDNVLLTIVNKG